MGLLFACGPRRSEIAGLTWGHVQEREGHKVLAHIHGKHGRVRTVKLPVWVWRRMMAWADAAALNIENPEGRIFRPVTKGGKVGRGGLTPQVIRHVLAEYAPGLAPP